MPAQLLTDASNFRTANVNAFVVSGISTLITMKREASLTGIGAMYRAGAAGR